MASESSASADDSAGAHFVSPTRRATLDASPGLPVRAKEGYAEVRFKVIVWHVDPLDHAMDGYFGCKFRIVRARGSAPCPHSAPARADAYGGLPTRPHRSSSGGHSRVCCRSRRSTCGQRRLSRSAS